MGKTLKSTVFDMSGECALVTGGGTGLGKQFAMVLSAAGAKVILCARRIDKLQETVRDVRDQGGEAHAIPMDVTDSDSVAAGFQQALEIDPVSVLINNAGLASDYMLLDMPEEEWDAIVDTNLKGSWLVCARRHAADDRPWLPRLHRQYCVSAGDLGAKMCRPLRCGEISGTSPDQSHGPGVGTPWHKGKCPRAGLLPHRYGTRLLGLPGRPAIAQAYTGPTAGRTVRNGWRYIDAGFSGLCLYDRVGGYSRRWSWAIHCLVVPYLSTRATLIAGRTEYESS